MTTGLLLITHGNLGQDMLDVATTILGGCPLEVQSVAVTGSSDPDRVYEKASRICEALDRGDGVLVLTDLYGSTPSNVATRLIERHNVNVIAGASIPMLLRVLNYPRLDLDELGEKAVSGAHDGVIITARKQAG
ncbi:MAG TPA: PTS sugar transporter subunit IIA [Gammaproteobacteria bacterium]|nr:PTS sugar transporter subunit IIA [Gammaproteobacteria bacterium]